jgi:hypothetical protein
MERMVREDPPYHVNYVCADTSSPPESVEISGGTTFHFVTDGIYAAFKRAKDAAKDKDVPIAAAPRPFSNIFAPKLINDLLLTFRPILMLDGESIRRHRSG